MEGKRIVGKKLAIGKSRTISSASNPSVHAEVDALNHLYSRRFNYKNCMIDILVVRFNTKGDLCSSRPCYHCLKHMEKCGFNINNIYYSNNNIIMKEKFKYMITNELTTISSGNRKKLLERLARPNTNINTDRDVVKKLIAKYTNDQTSLI